jgi:hypothetical protein
MIGKLFSLMIMTPEVQEVYLLSHVNMCDGKVRLTTKHDFLNHKIGPNGDVTGSKIFTSEA